MYSELIHIFFDITLASKLGNEMSSEDVSKRFIEIKKDMYLYAPDIVFKQFTEWLLNLNVHINMTDHFNDYYKLITLVRQDMGNKETKITRDDFMLFFMQDRVEYEKFKIENSWK